jgi:RimJ/RimL family protein N-acetyltransferase
MSMDTPGAQEHRLERFRRPLGDDFNPPTELLTERFHLMPLDVEYNERDYEAWTSSMEHIRATPGFPNGSWPHPMSPEENRRDLAGHAADRAAQEGFTYTVVDSEDGDVVGCVYFYPPGPETEAEVAVRSWVRASRAESDEALWRVVSEWLRRDWPWSLVDYAPRTT